MKITYSTFISCRRIATRVCTGCLFKTTASFPLTLPMPPSHSDQTLLPRALVLNKQCTFQGNMTTLKLFPLIATITRICRLQHPTKKDRETHSEEIAKATSPWSCVLLPPLAYCFSRGRKLTFRQCILFPSTGNKSREC